MKRCLRCESTFESAEWRCPACGYAPDASRGLLSFVDDDTGIGDSAFDEADLANLASLEEESFWFQARTRVILWALRRYFPGAVSLLEVGAGNGYVAGKLAAALPGVRISVSELNEAGLETAQRRMPEAELLRFDARAIPFDGEFGVVCAFDVLEHIDDDERVLVELGRAAMLGGGVLLTVPQHSWLWSASDEYAGHVRRYSRRELSLKLHDAGLEVCGATSFVTASLPLMALSRLLQRRGEYDPMREHRNALRWRPLLASLMAIDVSLIRLGVRLPVGGSLLVAARRRELPI